MLATTASETVTMLQTTPDIITQARENTKLMWAQLDPRSDWVTCTSAAENPMMMLVLKPEVVSSKKLSIQDQEHLLQDIVDEVNPPSSSFSTPIHEATADSTLTPSHQCLANSVLIARRKSIPISTNSKEVDFVAQPALKVCVTSGLTRKEIERAGITIRHAVTKVVKQRKS